MLIKILITILSKKNNFRSQTLQHLKISSFFLVTCNLHYVMVTVLVNLCLLIIFITRIAKPRPEALKNLILYPTEVSTQIAEF